MWRSDPADAEGQEALCSVTLHFHADGTLLYTIHEPDKDQVMRLTFRVEPGFIITDQPSQPQIERTAYEITPEGKLILAFGGEKSQYVKIRGE